MFIEATLYNNIVSLLPRQFLFMFIETKIVYNTIVSFFFLCAASILFMFIETRITTILRDVNVIQAYQNNDIESLLPCSLYSCLSYRIDMWNPYTSSC